MIAPGAVLAQTQAASAATANSASTPAKPTSKRWPRLRKPQLEVASTYGSGANISSITPTECTSPPKCLHTAAWPHSWTSLAIKKPRYSSTRLPGASTPWVWLNKLSAPCISDKPATSISKA